jgi:uncharacterized protein (TIGR02217 family)
VTLAIFPTLPGQGWSVKKTPSFSTRVASHSSGREVRTPLYAHALYAFELSFGALDSSGANAGLQAQSLQSLMGFWMTCNGQLDTFLYIDPTDNTATAQTIATGDGATTSFAIGRAIGGYFEPASYVTSIASVAVAGVATTSYTFTAPNVLTFSTAPASGAPIVATFSYGFQCRFLDDEAEFENFLSGLWKIDSLKFRQVR